MNKKEERFMKTAARLRMSDEDRIKAMREYIDNTQKKLLSDPERAQVEATKAFIRMGIATKDGKMKETIVSWE